MAVVLVELVSTQRFAAFAPGSVHLSAGETTPEEARNKWQRNVEKKRFQPLATAIESGQEFFIE